MWSAPCIETYSSYVDILVIDDLVWVRDISKGKPGKGGGTFTAGRDLHTGEIKRRIKAVWGAVAKGGGGTSVNHERCHPAKATTKYILTSRVGVEFADLGGGPPSANHWVRGTCSLGLLPCNGLLYAPPHACSCHFPSKFNGFFALAAGKNRPAPETPEPGERLEKGPAYGSAASRQSPIRNPQSEHWPTYRHDPARSGATDSNVPASLEIAWRAKLNGRLSSLTAAGGTVFVASVDQHSVLALDAATGETRWTFTAGGRIDSPPTIAGGLALFGCRDGHVYCLRASDGALAWRRRAAPEERRVVAFGQVESAWPVHGSVLVLGGRMYCVAGRSSYLDGGMRLCGLDVRDGRKHVEVVLDSHAEARSAPPAPEALPDILSTDGRLIFLHHLAFDPNGKLVRKAPPHLFSPTGFLDDTWFHRSWWQVASAAKAGGQTADLGGIDGPASGRLIVFNESSLYGFGGPLYAAHRKPPPQDAAPRRRAWARWRQRPPMWVRAMVLASETLFVAGVPDPLTAPPDRRASVFAGKQGALLMALSAATGGKLAEVNLEAAPVFDGLIAANGRLYLATTAGQVICLEGRDETEADRSEARKGPWDGRRARKPWR